MLQEHNYSNWSGCIQNKIEYTGMERPRSKIVLNSAYSVSQLGQKNFL